MLGFNGGLMGVRRTPTALVSSGLWFQNEQSVAQRAGIWPESTGTDPDFSSVSLLLHMDGSNGSTTFTDSSSGNVACVARGNATVSTAQSKFGGGSLVVDGTSQTCVTCATTSVHAFGTADFTIEGWVYLNSIGSDKKIFDFSYVDGVMLQLYPTTSSLWIKNTNYDFATTHLPTGQWVHFAVTRASNAINLWIDGTSRASGTNSTNIAASNELAIGAESGGREGNINGYIDEFRITKNVARYTSSFTPPTAPFPNA
jgi:hypothetical protein